MFIYVNIGKKKLKRSLFILILVGKFMKRTQSILFYASFVLFIEKTSVLSTPIDIID